MLKNTKIRVVYSENFKNILYSLNLLDWLKIEEKFNTSMYNEEWIIQDFLYEKKDWITIYKIVNNTKKKINLKIGKFLSNLNEYGLNYKPHQIEHMINDLLVFYQENLIVSNGTENLKHIYDSNNYYIEKNCYGEIIKKGILNSSCMRYPYKQKYLDFYLNCKYLRTIHIEKNGKVMARALLWNTEQNEVLMDRVYYTNKWEEKMFNNLAKKNNWIYYTGTTENNLLLKNDIEYTDILSVLFKSNSEFFPFTDTLKYYDPIDMRLSNKPFSLLTLTLNNVNGLSSVHNINIEKLQKRLDNKVIDSFLFKGFSNLLPHIIDNISIDKKIECLKKEIDVFGSRDDIFLLENNKHWISIKNERFIKKLDTKIIIEYLHRNDPNFNKIFECIDIDSIDLNYLQRYPSLFITSKLNKKNKEYLIQMMYQKGNHYDIFSIEDYYQFYMKRIVNTSFLIELLSINFLNKVKNKIKNKIELEEKELYLFVELFSNKANKFYYIGKNINDSNIKLLSIFRLRGLHIPIGTPLRYRKGFVEILRWFIFK